MIDFSNQNVLITGATGGIGESIAKLFHSHNAHVIISGTNYDKLVALSNQLKNNNTIKLCDLNDPDSCIKLISSLDHLDVLVCNAGITKDMLSIKMKYNDFDEVLKVNLYSSFILNSEAIKIMLKSRYGRIINLSSIVAVTGNIGQANYSASKAGLIGLTKSMAQEVSHKNITINAVAPGFIETPMTDKLSQNQKDSLLNKIPMKKFGTAEEVAYVIAFLASKQASYITGQTIHVNGGMVMI